MKRARILTAISAGIIIVVAISGLTSLWYILVNRYFQYGMLTLAALFFQETMNANFAFFFAALLAVYLCWLAFAGKTRMGVERFARVGVTAAVVVAALFSTDSLLKEFTGETLLAQIKGAVTKLGFRVRDLLPVGSISAVSGKHIAILIVLVASVVVIWSVRWLLKRTWRGQGMRGRCVEMTALVMVLLLVLMNLGLFIFASKSVPDGPNFIVLTIDCLRRDHLGCYGYGGATSPNIDGIARAGIVFDDAFSSAPWTKPSVASLFTSMYPLAHTAINKGDILPYEALTIAEILKNDGYYTCFLNGGNWSIDRVFNFQQGFDFYECSDRLRDAADLTALLLSRLSRARGRKFFAYVHYMDAHLPYHRNKYNESLCESSDGYFEPGDIYSTDVRKLTAAGRLSDKDKAFLVGLYDGQIRYVDDNIGRILSFLKDNELLRDTVLIVTADHGEEFWDHGNYEHGHTLYNELIQVPLIISGAGLKPAEMKGRVRLVDVLPTVLQLAKVETAVPNQAGVDFLAAYTQGENALDLPVFAMGTLTGSEKYCLMQGALKLIMNTGERDESKLDPVGCMSAEGFELYDLDRDPLEKENLGEREGDALVPLKRDLTGYMSAVPVFRGKEQVIEGELREKLKALGYVQ